jgi:hypothetical protein
MRTMAQIILLALVVLSADVTPPASAAAEGVTFPVEVSTDEARIAWLSQEMSRVHKEISEAASSPGADRAKLKELARRAEELNALQKTIPGGVKVVELAAADIRERTIPRYFLDFAWLIAAAFVVIHAVSRFNSPPTGRTETTLGRYWAAASAYAFVNLVAWIALLFFPSTLAWILEETKDVPTAGQALDAASRLALPAPFVAALIITSLVPHVRSLAGLDRKVRVFFYDLASSPQEALRLTKSLVRSPNACGRRSERSSTGSATGKTTVGSPPSASRMRARSPISRSGTTT